MRQDEIWVEFLRNLYELGRKVVVGTNQVFIVLTVFNLVRPSVSSLYILLFTHSISLEPLI